MRRPAGLTLPMQLEEHVGLAPQDVRLDRLVEEVDRAGLVALEHAVLVARAGGDEDDRHVARALAAAHQLGQLEAVHLRHLHVEQRQRDVVHEQQLERLGARARLQQLDVVAAQQRRQREQVLLEVVDEQALDASALHGHVPVTASTAHRGPASRAARRSRSSGSTRSAGASLQRGLGHERRPARCPGPARPSCRRRDGPPASPAAPSSLAPVRTMPSSRSP